jgi:ABC-type transport system involved in multi-copper enzyme maturation permease subunit
MKYLAILKDSLREARDSWVLLGLLSLFTVVILFVASLSFKPVSAERTMRLFFSPHPMQTPAIYEALNNRKAEKVFLMQGHWHSLQLETVELLRGDPDSPQSDYALTVSAGQRFRGHPMIAEMEPNAVAEKAAGEDRAEIAHLRKLFEDAEEVGYIKVAMIEPIAKGGDEQGPKRYRITVQGTPNTHRIWATETSVLFGAVPLDLFLSDAPLSFRIYKLAKFVISFGSWIAVLLGIVVTAFFIPNMLRKGTIDLLLVKPISRGMLLVYKYLGGLSFIFLTTAYAIGGIWLALGLRSGLWANGALLLIFSLTFFFAILYAVSALVSVVTRSVVMSILVTVIVYATLAVIGFAHSGAELFERMEKEAGKIKGRGGVEQAPEKDMPAWIAPAITTVKIVYAISPRTDDLNDINDLIVYTDFMTGNLGDMRKFDNSDRNWWVGFLVSTIWIGIFLGLASLWFTYKDY